MATLLYRLGRTAYRRPLLFLFVWVALAAGTLGGGVALGGQTQESFTIPGTESQTAIDRLAAVFPQTGGGSAQVVVKAPDGAQLDDPDVTKDVEDLAASIADVDGVAQALSPFNEYASDALSKDGTTGIIQVQFDDPADSVTDAQLEAVKDTAEPARADGLTVEFGGNLFQDVTYGITPTELIGVAFAAIVLILAFGSIVAAGLPLLIAIVSIAVALGGVMAVSAFTTISSATPLLALMLGLAVGIDYALFIVSRHRSQLARGMDPEESAATAVGTAGSAVMFAGVTVVIALVGLLVVGIPFLGAMGLAAAGAVVMAMLAAITLLPAMLGLLKGRLAPKPGSRAQRRAASDDEADRAAVAGEAPVKRSITLGERWVRLVMKAPVVFVIAVIGILGTLAIPAFSLALALPNGGSEPESSTARKAYDLIAEEFGDGRNGPLIVAVDITQTTDILADLKRIEDRLGAVDGVESVSTGIPNATVDTAIIQVVPTTAPDDPATSRLVERIRELAPSIEDDVTGPLWVTGTTAVQIDISDRLNNALVPFGIIVVGLSIVLLAAVFRSILVPLKAAIGFLLSLFAAFGVVVAVFQWGWGAEALGIVPGPILSFMPILLIAILFGLAMDYEVFLVSGMREAFVHGGDARRAVVNGFRGAARVVTAAAAIMFFVFASFVPEGAGVIKVIALGLAVGILADAFLVRMTLVPAVMALAGRGAWYLPKWLDRILPNVDIEGESLNAHRESEHWASQSTDVAIALDGLVAGGAGRSVGPLTATVPTGAIAFVAGGIGDRRLLAATLGGRLAPIAGRALVAGRGIPTESQAVARRVALAELAGPGVGGTGTEVAVTVGELVDERMRLTDSWYRGLAVRSRSRRWLERTAEVLPTGRSAEQLAALPISQLRVGERAIVLAALAIAERTPVLMLDLLDPLTARDLDSLVVAVHALAERDVTVVIAADTLPALTASPGREVVAISLADIGSATGAHVASSPSMTSAAMPVVHPRSTADSTAADSTAADSTTADSTTEGALR